MKRYESTAIKARFDGKQVYLTTQYPVIVPQDSDIVVISNEGDYLENLAFKYYADPTLWWVIAQANSIGRGRLSVSGGLQLRIPTNINDILVSFNNLNANASTQ